jgi:hypothetical protein
MNITFKSSAIILSSLLLAACGSSSGSGSSSSDDEEHGHDVLISQQNTDTLSVLEEGEAESLAGSAAANSAELLLSNLGEQAAVITAGSVQFVFSHDEDEDELPELSVTAITGTTISVVNTLDHFSVLADGATQLVPFGELENATSAAEALSLGITEMYPALLLEEGDEVVTLAFDGTDAVVYEDSMASSDTRACAVVDSTAQTDEFAVVSCDGATFSVKLEEGLTDHTIEINPITGVSTNVEWKTRADVFVGLGDDDKFYVLEENDSEALELEGTAFAAPVDMCAWNIDTLEADIFALTADTLTIYSHEGSSHSLTLDETQGAGCDDLRLAAANNAVFVIDSLNQVFYEIDKEEDATEYHIHGREDLSVNDVASAVVFHEAGTESEGHDH